MQIIKAQIFVCIAVLVGSEYKPYDGSGRESVEEIRWYRIDVSPY